MNEFVNCGDCKFWMKAGDTRHEQAIKLLALKDSSTLGICAKHAPHPSSSMYSFTGSFIKHKHLTQGKFEKSSSVISNEIKTSFVFPVFRNNHGCFEGEFNNG